jgi:hypothetical protein
MERDFKRMLAVALLFIATTLLLDTAGLVPQLLLGIATVVVVGWVCHRLRIPRIQLITCVIVATIGEVVLSLAWGLYSYQHAVIPMYVPPGHALLYALAAATARQSLCMRHERRIVWFILAMGSAVALFNVTFLGDTWGFLWWIAAAALLITSRNQLMLSACIGYTMLLEWVGTANGNWAWAAEVPGLGLTSANPPAGVGLLYVLLDLIVVAIGAYAVPRRAGGVVGVSSPNY